MNLRIQSKSGVPIYEQIVVQMRELILKLNREKQITVLISSHILGELSKIATHYGIIREGILADEFAADTLK